MRKLQVCLGFTLLAAACGNDTAKPIDAPPKTPDAETPDAKVYDDAPPPSYRTTFVYPPYPLAASTTGVETLIVSPSTFSELEGIAGGVTQDDTTNGVVFAAVTDCENTPLGSATLSVTTTTDTTTQVGTQFNLGSLASQAAGLFVVFNVPAGAIDIGATDGSGDDSHTLHTVQAIAYANGGGVTNGSLTTTIVRPGPGSGTGSAGSDFTCASNPAPTTAPATLTISGTAVTLSGTSEADVADVTVTAYTDANNTVLGSATSGSNGTYTMTVSTTDDLPIAGYLEAN
jgi:hypothetical protein